ncbi:MULTISPECIES: DUF4381 domain-containing protein [Kaistia]|uniref:DUF4381 domain-containing protein n=1 Tax=Kaistia nematophila TaxID=2994654 RepID=A0A9X3E0H7_9HYPH|nr:DUF4381 domain-containing protein [Kaistia nematophila]MCX5569280.1 DUF4381 domain-containing protein [Kaistia nematophila]
MSGNPSDLSNLRDIVLPAPVPFWPPAPGWWILAAAVLAGLVLLAARQVVRRRHDAYRRQALRELAALPEPLDAAGAQRLSSILKRTALVAFPRSEVAALTGVAWLRFLDQTGRMRAFETGPAQSLPRVALGAPAPGDDSDIRRAARDWIRRHRAAGW